MTVIETIMQHPGPFLAWMLPIFGALMMPVLGRINHKLRDYGAVAFAFSAVVAAASMVPDLLSGHTAGDIKLITWMTLPNGTPLEFGVLVDPLSIIIANVVAFISFLIVVYSTSYMHGDPHLDRYWFLFLYFIGNMLLLVMANNLVMTLIGWEGVGICSYGLIGYYYRDAKERWLGGPPPTEMYPPSHAGMKAFVVTGIGDVLILGAIFILYYYAGTFNYHDLIHHSTEWLSHMAQVPGLVALFAVLLLGGPIGKSAQFPLHEWLPEAMAGPTSVSALIHAATMVKAGVYLVARMSPVFYVGTWTLNLPEAQVYFIAIALVGAFTCFLAATQALVAVELKKILAYSTVSQIGYMMLGLGLSGFSEGAYIPGLTAGIYHLASHAMFKGALFLGAGSVIHAVHTIYTFNMGGLKKYMKYSYVLMGIATLSLSGVPPFSGFWSKDAVFLAALEAGTPLAYALLFVGVVSAAMTFAYSIRYISNTFRGDASKYIHDMEHHGHAPHEAPKVMWVPIAILVVLFSITGLLGLVGVFVPNLNPEIFIEEAMHNTVHHLLPPEIADQMHVTHISGTTKLIGAGLSALALAVGGFLGYNFYWARNWDSWAWVQASDTRKSIHNFLWNRWYMNAFFYRVFVDGILNFKQVLYDGFEAKALVPLSDVVASVSQSFSEMTYQVLEEGAIFGVINKGVPSVIIGAYHRIKKTQTGLLSMNLVYVVVMLIAIIVLMLETGGF
ncbi:MAG: NADH-quinone oxidoreductase subunit L [Candidatus Bathyarchaeota archaeon]|nr:NADH-quinone oxidoreductase subunit L [Candidatus Bathyarchaeota archaeon]